MIRIRANGFARFHLDKQVGTEGKYGIWSFHEAANSEMFPGLQAGRHAAILPAEPKEGQEVEVFALLHARSPQEEWKPCGKGVAHIM
jgi:hypothetical protein